MSSLFLQAYLGKIMSRCPSDPPLRNISTFVPSSHASLCALRSGISLSCEAPVYECCKRMVIVGGAPLSKPLLLRLSSVDHLLHLGIDSDHSLI